MELFFQLLLNGLVAGSLYGLVAVGFALIFGATRHFHIAHAGVFAAAGYGAAVLAQRTGLPTSLAVIVSIVVAVLIGVALARGVYVPLGRRGGQGFVLFLVSLGAMTIIENLFTLWVGAQPQRLELGGWFTHVLKVGSWSLTAGQVGIILLGGAMFLALMLTLRHTRAGKLIKAYSGNPEFIQIVGHRPSRVLVLVYAVGSTFAAVAGVYVGGDTGMQPGLGETYFIISIMAVFIGGIGSISGAFVSAMVLGVLQNVLLQWIHSQWTLPVIFTGFLILITASPSGLAGLRMQKRRAA